MSDLNDTIVAVATPPGRGGVAIVRLSGSLSHTITQHLTKQIDIKPRKATYTKFFAKNDVLLDDGIVIYFKSPHSFTGEDVVELQCHGAPIILDCLIQEAINYGARLARPGEFSERAFLNGKIDLAQAEAIADLINASSLTAARMAIRSLQGDFSQKISQLSEQIINLRLYVEAAIDFPEEEIDFLGDGKVASLLNEIIVNFTYLKQTTSQGTMLREGLSVVIAGKPNAGKSTLINRLAGREIAIVTEIAGTTRDVVREHILLDDLPVQLIDTAGLRESNDLVEQEGIKRAWQEVSQADCVLLVIDIRQDDNDNALDQAILAQLPTGVPLIKILNKVDTVNELSRQENNTIYLSAKLNLGIDLLINKIKAVVGFQPAEGQFLARRRHLDALNRVEKLLLTGQQQLIEAKAGELLAEDLRLAHLCLSEITGKFTSDDLLGKIFSSFCIGK